MTAKELKIAIEQQFPVKRRDDLIEWYAEEHGGNNSYTVLSMIYRYDKITKSWEYSAELFDGIRSTVRVPADKIYAEEGYANLISKRIDDENAKKIKKALSDLKASADYHDERKVHKGEYSCGHGRYECNIEISG